MASGQASNLVTNSYREENKARVRANARPVTGDRRDLLQIKTKLIITAWTRLVKHLLKDLTLQPRNIKNKRMAEENQFHSFQQNN